jgi:hypothetical protein
MSLPNDPGTSNFASGSFVHRHQYDELRDAAVQLERLADIGKRWETDSSLDKWFPFTAKEVETLKELNADKFCTIEAYCKAASTDKWKIKTLLDAIDRYLSASGYSAHANILTDARAEVVNLKP